MSQDTESRIAAMEAKLQTLETFLPALLNRFEQSEAKLETRLARNAQEARQERKESEAKLETRFGQFDERLAQNAQEARRDRKELEARMLEGRRSAFYFGVGTIIALFTLAAAVYFGFQNLGAGA